MPAAASEEYAPLAPSESQQQVPKESHQPSPKLLLWVRRITSITVLVIFLVTVLSYGLVDHFTGAHTGDSAGNSTEPAADDSSAMARSKPKLPDLSNYGERLKTLQPSELRFKRGGRMIVVGDIHGMKDSLDHLLKKLRYKPHKDTLIHAGDTMTKGPKSMQVLEFLASNNITGVRGNHDQKIIEWRAWFNWVRSFPDGPEWIANYEDDSLRTAIAQDAGAQAPVASRPDTDRFPIPDDWKWASEHWHIARAMTDEQYHYLLSLPLVLHIPSIHALVVHAGLLPVDPTRGVTSSHQPLARIPILPKSGHHDTKLLRAVQEIALVNDIPQNQDPWAVLNMRSVLSNGKVSKKNDEGDPWPKLWNKIMKRCKGFDGKGSDHLPCYPFTIMYGHAASRGLDLRKWSKGLDSGCIYGRKLSALVYSDRVLPADAEEGEEEDYDEDLSVETTQLGHSLGKAKIISIRCK